MRRILVPVVVTFILLLAETSILPNTLPPSLRPRLLLIVTAVWASLRGGEGLVWAFFAGLMLDATTAGPFGLNTAGLVLGNAVATMFDQIPLPSRLFRATNWTVVVTVVWHAVLIAGIGLVGESVDTNFAVSSQVLPSLLISPLVAIPAYGILNAISEARVGRSRVPAN